MSDQKLVCCIGDTNSSVRQITSSVADAMSFEVSECPAITEAHLTLRAIEPQIIVLDWDIASAEELAEFFQKLRKIPGRRSIPVVVAANAVHTSLVAMSTEYAFARIIEKTKLEDQLQDILSGLFAEQEKSSSLKSAFLKLDRALDSGVPAEIDAAAEELYAAYPDNMRAQLEFANYCIRHRQYDQAEEIVIRVLNEYPQHLRALNIKSRLLLLNGRAEDAHGILSQCDLLSPANVDRLVMIGDAHYQQGHFEEARKKYESALDVDAESKDAKKGVGAVELSTGDVNKALEFFRESATEEEMASIYNTAAIMAVRSGHFEKGLRLYTAARSPIKTPRLLSKVVFNMGLAYKKWNKNDAAEKCFEEAVKLSPENQKAVEHLTLMRSKTGVASQPVEIPFQAPSRTKKKPESAYVPIEPDQKDAKNGKKVANGGKGSRPFLDDDENL